MQSTGNVGMEALNVVGQENQKESSMPRTMQGNVAFIKLLLTQRYQRQVGQVPFKFSEVMLVDCSAGRSRTGGGGFCKLLLLSSINTMTDTGMKLHECAYVSVLEEYKGPQRPGYFVHILYIVHILHFLVLIFFYCCTAWLDVCQSIIY